MLDSADIKETWSLEDSNLQVSDFGLSVAISEKPERMLLNSVCWAAPEKIQAVPGYDPKAADVYRSASAPFPYPSEQQRRFTKAQTRLARICSIRGEANLQAWSSTHMGWTY